MTFAERLAQARQESGLTQDALAGMLDVSRQTVSKWELGVTTPEMDRLILLADLLHISIDELVGRKIPDTHNETTDFSRCCDPAKR